jgi:hypothetical protein
MLGLSLRLQPVVPSSSLLGQQVVNNKALKTPQRATFLVTSSLFLVFFLISSRSIHSYSCHRSNENNAHLNNLFPENLLVDMSFSKRRK